VPDSVAEGYFRVVCVLTKRTTDDSSAESNDKLAAQVAAQIITRNANVRESPTTDSRIVRKVAKGARLLLADTKPTSGGWYRVLTSDTKETGWLHGSTIKLITLESKSKPPNQKAEPTVKHTSTGRINP
jgi:uncharacterized protein YgiM (DUF1202 family)